MFLDEHLLLSVLKRVERGLRDFSRVGLFRVNTTGQVGVYETGVHAEDLNALPAHVDTQRVGKAPRRVGRGIGSKYGPPVPRGIGQHIDDCAAAILGDDWRECLALGLLRRDRTGRYSNSRRAKLFLDRDRPSYIGGLMELSSKRLYDLWSGLGDLLRTGRPAAAEESGENEFFDTLYRDPTALKEFLAGMTGISTGEATLIAGRFPWKRLRTFVDIGAAQGALPVRVALAHPHLSGASYDLAPAGPIFEEYVASFGLIDRLRFIAGDMLEGPLPGADVISHRPSPKLEHHAGEPRRLRVDDNAVCGLASRCRLQSGDAPTPHRPYLDAVRI